MALDSAVKGATHSGQLISWYRRDGTLQDLTGATITAEIQDTSTLAGTRGTFLATGIFTVVDGPNGVFSWQYSASDVSIAGTYKVQFRATYADTTYDATYLDKGLWKVESAL